MNLRRSSSPFIKVQFTTNLSSYSPSLRSSDDPLMDPKDPQYPIQLAKHWIQRCLETHSNCKSIPSGWLPSRLLYLMNSNPAMARLVKTDNYSIVGPYATLSHCWGTAEFFKHTSQTSSELYSGISVSILPQTFQDAIYTTIQLGIDYIWIDSLCIVQDDHDDWLRESAIMGRVYQNGYCNIAATKSSAAAIGFAEENLPRTKSLRPPCYIQSNWTDFNNARVHLYKQLCVEGGPYLSGPLLQRGWVVQERVMAPRTVHFGSNQIFWECWDTEACETYPNGMIPSNRTTLDKHAHGPLSRYNSFSDAINLWESVVRTFSVCRLTMPNDKLVALSGIAKAIQGQFPDMEYLAGLWKCELKEQLMWRVVNNGVRPPAYIAPSWSWASLNGTISYQYNLEGDLSCIEILDAFVKPLGADPTGQIENGFLRVVGPLMTLSIPGPLDDDWHVPLLINGHRGIATGFFPDIRDDRSDHLHCLPTFCKGPRGGEPDYFICLILRPTGVKKGNFVRYGVCRFQLYAFGIETVDRVPRLEVPRWKLPRWKLPRWKLPRWKLPRWKDAENEDRVLQWGDIKNEEWFEFEEDHGHGSYTITII